ncbi:putative holin-like toxin [Lentibacillus halophilus]
MPLCTFLGKGVMPMTVFETLFLMISFGTLIVAILSNQKK